MTKKKKILWWHVAFIVYLCVLLYFLFFAEILGRSYFDSAYQYNIVPFREIRRYLRYHETIGTFATFVNLEGNILAFIPFGMLLPCVKKDINLLRTVLFTALFSAIVEGLQFLMRVGICDVDDVILNTIGGLCGYVIYVLAVKVKRHKDKDRV